MRTLLITITVLFTFLAQAQKIRLTDTAYAAQGIVIDADSVSINDILNALYVNGYVIETASYYVISTKFNALRGSWKYDIFINRIGNKYVFRIYFHVGDLVGHDVCINRGHKKSGWITGFNSLLEVVESLDVPFKYIATDRTSDSNYDIEESNDYNRW